MRSISQERERFIKEATYLESLIKQPGWVIIKEWIDAEKQVADIMLHNLEKNDQFDMMNAKITFNFVTKLETMITGIIENKYKLIRALDSVEGKSKVRRKNE